MDSFRLLVVLSASDKFENDVAEYLGGNLENRKISGRYTVEQVMHLLENGWITEAWLDED